MSEKKKTQLKIELPENRAEGHYSNFTVISHSGAEFVLDFARIVHGSPKAVVQSRVIMTPIHAKTLLYTLRDNVQKYESKFGEIQIPDRGQKQQMGFDLTDLTDELPN